MTNGSLMEVESIAERGVWSGSALFANRIFYQSLNKNEKYHPTSLKTKMNWSNW